LKPGNLRGPLVAELTASTAHMKTHNRRGPLVAELTAPTARLEAYNRHALLVAELTAPKARFQGSRTRRGLLVAERSTATARFWGSPLGPRLWGSQSPRSVRCRTLRSDCLLLGLASGASQPRDLLVAKQFAATACLLGFATAGGSLVAEPSS